MLLELLKNYADVINGATRMTQRSATAIARAMLMQAGMEPAADMVSRLSEQMIAAQDAQYAMMRRIIQAEVDMTLARMRAMPTIGAAAMMEAPAEADSDTADPAPEAGVFEMQAAEVIESETAPPQRAPEPDAAPAERKAETATPAPVEKAPAKRAPARKTSPRRSTIAKSTTAKPAGNSTPARTASTRTTRSASTRGTATGVDAPDMPEVGS